MPFENESKFKISSEDSLEQVEAGNKEEIMETPEIIIQPEKGSYLMSLAIKGYDLGWGNNDSELTKLTERHFRKHPLDEVVKEKMDKLKSEGVDEETMYNLAITYQNPERTGYVFDMMEKHKNIPREKAEKLQREVIKVLSHFDENPLFKELEERFTKEMEKDIRARAKRLEESRKKIEGLIDFFKPKSETTPVKKINIIPEDPLYKKQSGKVFIVARS
jgi:hypothetical protein